MMEINRDRIARTFAEFVEIDSPSYHERKMADSLKSLYGELGILLEEDGCAQSIGGDT